MFTKPAKTGMSLDLRWTGPEFAILGADRKERGLWGQEWRGLRGDTLAHAGHVSPRIWEMTIAKRASDVMPQTRLRLTNWNGG